MLKTKKEIILLVLIAVLALAIICVLVIGLTNRTPQPEAAAPIADPIPSARVVVREVEKLVEVEKTITPEIIEDGLRDMGVLITEEYYFTEVVSFSSVKKFLKTDISLGFTETSYLASYDGVVSAGIDFSGISVEKDDAAKRITVCLPASEVRTVTVDPNSFQLYSEKVGLGNPLSMEDFNSSLTELENNAKAKALDRGLLDRADETARTVVGNFIAGLVDLSVYALNFAD